MKKFLLISNHSKFKFICLLLVLFIFYFFLSAYFYVNAVSSDIATNLFRLHVIANSDTEEDQTLKYQVKDNIIKYMNTLTKDINSKKEAIHLAIAHTDDLQRIAEETIKENGFNYPVHISIGNFYFPTKTYGDISFPAGNYDALRIEIGNASGQNWWCVMFPPLCFVDVSTGIVPDDSKSIIKDNLSNEEYSLISEGNTSNDTTSISLKFKLIELFHSQDIFTAKH